MEKLIFLGDSITDCRRLWTPEYSGLGNGYVWNLKKPLEQAGVTVLNKGHDGFTMSFLLRTLERDCLRHHPDGVSVLIGINDVALSKNTGRSLTDQEFGAAYDTLLRRLLDNGVEHIFLLGPFLFPKPLEFRTWMDEVREAEAIEAAAAKRCGLPFLPLLDKMNQSAEEFGTDAVTTDGIHLTAFGHQLLADWWLDFFNIGTFDRS